jgi:hypothetical protein
LKILVGLSKNPSVYIKIPIHVHQEELIMVKLALIAKSLMHTRYEKQIKAQQMGVMNPKTE